MSAEFGVKLCRGSSIHDSTTKSAMLEDDPGWNINCSTSDRAQPSGLSSAVEIMPVGSFTSGNRLVADSYGCSRDGGRSQGFSQRLH